jgi:chaperonin GroES
MAQPQGARSTSAAKADRPVKAVKPTKRRKRATGGEDVRLPGDRLVVEHPDNGERKSRSGLLIPATAQPAPRRCMWSEVVLVGPDVRSAKKGDRVLFLPQAGLEVELHDEEYLLLRERDIQAVEAKLKPGEHEPGQYL